MPPRDRPTLERLERLSHSSSSSQDPRFRFPLKKKPNKKTKLPQSNSGPADSVSQVTLHAFEMQLHTEQPEQRQHWMCIVLQ